MKKIISLGGNYFQMTAVKAAKKLGYYVIDVDYLPDNPAHAYADEYVNISIVDKEEVLALALDRKIDGIISFASDVGAPTAAYVAEKMGLPTNPIKTVELMTRKDLFHPYLREKGFFVPKTKSINSLSDIKAFYEECQSDIILKPVNASGSKGITRIKNSSQIENAYDEAKKYSRDSVLVAEEFIERDYYQIAGDAFVIDGEIAFWGLANEHFDIECNPLVPIGESFPVDLDSDKIRKARDVVSNALKVLGYKTGAVNLDFMFTKSDEVFIIELGPRNGGNLISDAIKMSCGVDLAEITVKAAVGEDISYLKDVQMDRYISSYVWHATQNMIFSGIKITNELKSHLLQSEIFVKPGDEIHRFDNGGFGIGMALMEFESKEQMIYMMDHMDDYYKIY